MKLKQHRLTIKRDGSGYRLKDNNGNEGLYHNPLTMLKAYWLATGVDVEAVEGEDGTVELIVSDVQEALKKAETEDGE
jgi:uncharacterized protein YrzB (UPF0473 family)